MMIIAERELKPLVLNPPPNVTRVVDEASEEKLVAFLEQNTEHGFDVETTPVKDFFYRRLRTLQFGTNQEQYVVDLLAYCNGDSDLLYNCQAGYGSNLHKAPKFAKLIKRLEKYICSDNHVKVGVNLSFEYECFYWLCGLRIYGLYDCMLAEKCIYAGLGGSAGLKNYDFYSMESMFERYFGMMIDKTLQTSFTLDGELTDAQVEYAALDTRVPLGIKLLQTIIASGETPKSLKEKGKPKLADYLYYLDSIILGDNLHEIIKIECEAIGSFVDMHVHGERIDRERWKARVQKSKDKLVANLQALDKIFLPIVGSKLEAIDDETINKLEVNWKQLGSVPSDKEIEIKLQLSSLKKKGVVFLPETPLALGIELQQLETERKAKKEILKAQCGELKKKRTKIKKLFEKCEGEALINYSSDAQLRHALTDPENFKYFPRLFKDEKVNGTKTGNKIGIIETLDDETLELYESNLVIKLIREYHGLSKEIGTYGDAWATEWATHPCKEEGWLHPGDGRLHSTFNQLDAATGRSSSSQPNGQNLPQDKEVRSCFVADPSNELIRISNCCESEIYWRTIDAGYGLDIPVCSKCNQDCSTHAEEYVDVTADMSGAELRIIAEDANDPVWILAFAKGEDVHSVGTELLYDEEWLKEALNNCAYYAPHTAETVAKNPLRVLGEPQHDKCKCPSHKERRDENKATNFLLAYGGGATTLAVRIKKSVKDAKLLMALHEMKNPRIWAYLDKSGKDAARNFKAFDLFGRRRLLPEPTTERATENCKEWNEKELRLAPEDAQKNIDIFVQLKGRNPTQSEKFDLTHRPPTAKEVGRSYFQMSNSITRQGKNHRIQGTNATIAKKAMGAGYDAEGKPFLFHTLSQYRARIVKFVHDELVVQCPKQYGEKVAELIGDAFKRAAALRMKKVVMEFDYHIEKYWSK
jgi:DNA polymerase I-like protein with 3'-5' exonuclease and polymerase domains